MLSPADMKNLVPHAPVTRMLDALPGDAGAKRRFLCLTAARETSTALAHLVSTKSLTDICSGRPAYSIPLEEVLDARLSRRSQSLILTAADDSYRYFFRNAHDLDRMWRELGDLGVAGAGGQG
jgi:hypothetical protein